MTDSGPFLERLQRRRLAPFARRIGYAIAIVFNLAVIYLAYVQPGWRAVPFLTDDAAFAVALIVAGAIVGIVVNLIWLVTDPRWLRAVGELATTVIGIVVLATLLRDFPFDFGGHFPDVAARALLVLGLVGASIGVVVTLVVLVLLAAGRGSEPAAD